MPRFACFHDFFIIYIVYKYVIKSFKRKFINLTDFFVFNYLVLMYNIFMAKSLGGP